MIPGRIVVFILLNVVDFEFGKCLLALTHIETQDAPNLPERYDPLVHPLGDGPWADPEMISDARFVRVRWARVNPAWRVALLLHARNVRDIRGADYPLQTQA